MAWVLSMAFIHECQAQNKSVIKFGNSGPNTVLTGVDSITTAFFAYQEADGVDGQDIIPATTWTKLSINTEIFNPLGITLNNDTLTVPPGIYIWQEERPFSSFGSKTILALNDGTQRTVGSNSIAGLMIMTVRIDLSDTTKLWTEAYSELGESSHQFGPSGDGFPETYAYIQITRVGDAEQITGNIAQDIVSFAVDQAVTYYGVGNDNLGEPAAADGSIVVGKTAGSDTAQTDPKFRYLQGKMGVNFEGTLPGTLSLGQYQANEAGPSIVLEDKDTLNSSPFIQFRRDFIDGFTVTQSWPKEHFKIQGMSESNTGPYINFQMRVMQEGIGTFFNPNSFDITTTDATQAIFTRWGIDKDGEIKYWRPLVEASDSAVYLVREGDGKIRGRMAEKYAVLQHVETGSADGGNYNTPETWQSRKINTKQLDEIGITIVNDTAFTLPSGTYEIDYSTQFVTTVAGAFATSQLYDHTGSQTLHRGQLVISEDQFGGLGFIVMQESTVIEIDSTSTISLQQACNAAGTQFGDSQSLSGIWSDGNNVYATIKIKKVR